MGCHQGIFERTLAMPKTNMNFIPDRRHFLGRVLPAGCLSCLSLSCRHAAPAIAQKLPSATHKFQEDSQLSFEEVFRRMYRPLVETLNDVAEEIGRDKLIAIVKAQAEKHGRENGQRGAKSGAGDFRSFTDWAREPDRFWQHVLTFTVVEDTPKAFEVKVTECLWAETFRGAKGEDFGYATICHPDFASASGYSSNLELVRTKTLMQGDAVCNHRWIWRG